MSVLRRYWRTVALFLLVGFVGIIGYGIGVITAGTQASSLDRAAYALRKTGLAEELAPHYWLYGFTGFRDTFAITQCRLHDDEDRLLLLAQTKRTKGWHQDSVTVQDFETFASSTLWEYAEVLQLSEGMVFDAWYYCETSAPASFDSMAPAGPFEEIGQTGRGFEFAVYDADTGMFIFVDQFG